MPMVRKAWKALADATFEPPATRRRTSVEREPCLRRNHPRGTRRRRDGSTRMNVVDNAARGRFELSEDGITAFADYHVAGGVMVLPHTVVPPEARGRGMAGRLVRGALDAARERGLKVSPACSYVDAYMRRHPETQDLLA